MAWKKSGIRPEFQVHKSAGLKYAVPERRPVHGPVNHAAVNEGVWKKAVEIAGDYQKVVVLTVTTVRIYPTREAAAKARRRVGIRLVGDNPVDSGESGTSVA